MSDRFAETVKDRVYWHTRPIRREVEGLRGVAYDFKDHLSPEFETTLRDIEKNLTKLDELVLELESRS